MPLIRVCRTDNLIKTLSSKINRLANKSSHGSPSRQTILLFVFSMMLLLSGCDKHNHSMPMETQQELKSVSVSTSTISGRVSTNTALPGRIEVFQIGQTGPARTAIATTTTNAQGYYTLSFFNQNQTPLLVRFTRTPDIQDEESTSIDKPLALEKPLILESIVLANQTSLNHWQNNISVLSHIAAQHALTELSATNNANYSRLVDTLLVSQTNVNRRFNIPGHFSHKPLINLNNISEIDTANKETLIFNLTLKGIVDATATEYGEQTSLPTRLNKFIHQYNTAGIADRSNEKSLICLQNITQHAILAAIEINDGLKTDSKNLHIAASALVEQEEKLQQFGSNSMSQGKASDYNQQSLMQAKEAFSALTSQHNTATKQEQESFIDEPLALRSKTFLAALQPVGITLAHGLELQLTGNNAALVKIKRRDHYVDYETGLKFTINQTDSTPYFTVTGDIINETDGHHVGYASFQATLITQPKPTITDSETSETNNDSSQQLLINGSIQYQQYRFELTQTTIALNPVMTRTEQVQPFVLAPLTLKGDFEITDNSISTKPSHFKGQLALHIDRVELHSDEHPFATTPPSDKHAADKISDVTTTGASASFAGIYQSPYGDASAQHIALLDSELSLTSLLLQSETCKIAAKATTEWGNPTLSLSTIQQCDFPLSQDYLQASKILQQTLALIGYSNDWLQQVNIDYLSKQDEDTLIVMHQQSNHWRVQYQQRQDLLLLTNNDGIRVKFYNVSSGKLVHGAITDGQNTFATVSLDAQGLTVNYIDGSEQRVQTRTFADVLTNTKKG